MMSRYDYYYPKRISGGKWRETKAVIAQYYELLAEYKSIIEGEAVVADGMPKGNHKSDPTASRAIRAERIRDKIAAIEKSQEVIEPEYRKGVMDYLTKGKRFPDDASERTYRRKIRAYVVACAKNLYII